MRLLLSLAAVGLALLACDTSVTISGTGGSSGSVGGSGGSAVSSSSAASSGSTVSSTSSSGTTGSSSSSSSGAPGDPVCVAKCGAESAHGCSDPAACNDTCEKVLTSPAQCAPELTALYACIAAHTADITGCSMPSDCTPEFGKYLFCVDAICPQPSCDDQQGVCSCKATCAGQAVSSVCKGAACTCFIGGQEVGTCSDASMPICGLDESCCAVMFFLD